MKTLIVYDTRHGCTEKYVQMLTKGLSDTVIEYRIKDKSKIDFDEFDTIIVGGSIHAGRIQGSVKRFCDKKRDLLLKKTLGLFICCMEENEKARLQFEENFPAVLRNHATASGIFGGELNFDAMNALERYIIKKVAKTDKTVSKISEKFAAKFVQDLM